jgi:hypothetical protein
MTLSSYLCSELFHRTVFLNRSVNWPVSSLRASFTARLPVVDCRKMDSTSIRTEAGSCATLPKTDGSKGCVLMKILAPILIAALLLAPQSPIPVQARDKRPPLPTMVMNARTIYVDNHTTSAELQNTAYTELSKWGRFQVVDTPQKADIVLQLSNWNYVKFVPGEGGRPLPDPKAGKQDWMGADESVPPGSTRISLIDPKTGNSLWSDVRKTDSPKAATHLLDGLREAFDQKEKSH